MQRSTTLCLLAAAVAGLSATASAQYWERQGGVTFSTAFSDASGVVMPGGDRFGDALIFQDVLGSIGGGHTFINIIVNHPDVPGVGDVDTFINEPGLFGTYPDVYSGNTLVYGFGDDLSQRESTCTAADCITYSFGGLIFGSIDNYEREFQVPNDTDFFYHAFEFTNGRRGFLQCRYERTRFEKPGVGTVTRDDVIILGWALWDADATDDYVAFDVEQGLYCTGDMNLDGSVNLGDFGIFGAAFNSTPGDSHWNPDADLDNDGDVDLGDFGLFAADFGSDETDCRGF